MYESTEHLIEIEGPCYLVKGCFGEIVRITIDDAETKEVKTNFGMGMNRPITSDRSW